ncbi:MAG: helix-turn-helix domain-containing protein [Lachnospiraceae bacterium]|jgi:hypothetical protein|nr:helix-turn-helix domain-containing protein [Lachnospiraceae bacterium]
MFNKLMDKDFRDILEIITLAHNQEWTSLSIVEVEKISGFGKKRLQSIVYEFNKVERDFTIPANCTVKIEHNNLYINFTSDFSFLTLSHQLIKLSIKYRLLISVIRGEFKSREHFAEKENMSVTTVRHLLLDINQFLEQFSLSIKLKTKEIIVGKEGQVRYFLLTLAWAMGIDDKYHFLFNTSYDDTTKELISDLIKELYRKSDHILAPQVYALVSVFKTRIEQGYFFTEENFPPSIPVNPILPIDDCKETLEKLFSHLGVPSTYIANEINLFYFMFSIWNLYSPSECLQVKLEKNQLEILKKEQRDFYKVWVNEFEKTMGVVLSDNEIQFIKVNLFYMFVSDTTFNSAKIEELDIDYGVDVLQVQSPHLFYIITNFQDKLFANEKCNIFNKPEAFKNRLTPLILYMVERHQPIVNILYLSKESIVHQEYTFRIMRQYIRGPIKFISVESDEMPDLIASDYYDNIRKDYPNIPFYQLHPYPRDIEWNELNEKINDIRIKKLNFI